MWCKYDKRAAVVCLSVKETVLRNPEGLLCTTHEPKSQRKYETEKREKVNEWV